MKSVLDFAAARQAGRKIVMTTCYDAWTARLLQGTGIDCVLVGDSGVMVMHGAHDTVAATVDMMAAMTRAVRLGGPELFVVADLPFLSYRGSLDRALDSVRPLMVAGAQAVKLEGARGHLPLVEQLVSSGIPVMGHLGLTPQSVHALGGYRVQGRSEAAAEALLQDARDLQEAGCFALVLECVPSALARRVTEQLAIPTIGIGAGDGTDGQVLVLHDLLGAAPASAHQPRFVRRYADVAGTLQSAVNQFAEEVRSGAFPSAAESYA